MGNPASQTPFYATPMRHFTATALVFAALCACASAQIRRPGSASSEEGVYSRTIIHPDETRTVSKQDLNNKIREKRTLDKNGILLMKSIFKLNASGNATNGLVYDGRNRLLYRSEFAYDGANRIEEERVYDAGGSLVRRLFYRADKLGRRKPVSQTIFKNGSERTSSSGNLESYSTTDSHAYRGGGGVANTPSAYRPTAASRTKQSSSTNTRTTKSTSGKKKRERRFRIFRRK